MTDDAVWRAQAAARPGMCVYPPTRAEKRSRSGVDDDQARRDALATLGPPLPEEREGARLAALQRDDPDEYARILGLPTPEEAARLRQEFETVERVFGLPGFSVAMDESPLPRATSRPTRAEPNPAGTPPTTSPAPTAQTRWAARLGALLTRWRKP